MESMLPLKVQIRVVLLTFALLYLFFPSLSQGGGHMKHLVLMVTHLQPKLIIFTDIRKYYLLNVK